jgi:fructosamine-3-kinase
VSLLPESAHEGLRDLLGVRVRDARAVGGGMVGRTARVETDSGPIFVKWKEGAPPRWFEMEEDGLDRLRAACPLRVPRVLAWRDSPDSDPPFLALEWLDPRPAADRRGFDRRLGEGLAQMHRSAVSPTGMFGLERDNFLGSQPQPNAWNASWPDFYRDSRLMPQIERADRLALLPASVRSDLSVLLDRLPRLLAGHAPTPRLIHGDLWAGNLLEAGDEPALIDPAVYYADREMELAYMQLFSGFSAETFEAYQAAFPLDEGYEIRRPLHQLYPLLIHLNHFGQSYLPQVAAACRIYLM